MLTRSETPLVLRSLVPEAVSGAARSKGKITSLESELTDAKTKGENLLKRLQKAVMDKGQYPPCWYKTVEGKNGKLRERPLYIFDVRISDDNIFVKDISAPTPEYELQKPKLPFDRSALNKSIGFGKFLKSFQPLKDAAENGKVQDYPCKFYVKVWDATTSKKTYRLALENVVETVFFKYLVKRRPWPH